MIAPEFIYDVFNGLFRVVRSHTEKWVLENVFIGVG
jgi:hypothetical protein